MYRCNNAGGVGMKYIITWTLYTFSTLSAVIIGGKIVERKISHISIIPMQQEAVFTNRDSAFMFYKDMQDSYMRCVASIEDSTFFIPLNGAVNNVKIDSTVEITKY